MKIFNIRRYETRNGYNFYVQDPNARKRISPIMGTIKANTIDDAIKNLKSYFNNLHYYLRTQSLEHQSNLHWGLKEGE